MSSIKSKSLSSDSLKRVDEISTRLRYLNNEMQTLLDREGHTIKGREKISHIKIEYDDLVIELNGLTFEKE